MPVDWEREKLSGVSTNNLSRHTHPNMHTRPHRVRVLQKSGLFGRLKVLSSWRGRKTCAAGTSSPALSSLCISLSLPLSPFLPLLLSLALFVSLYFSSLYSQAMLVLCAPPYYCIPIYLSPSRLTAVSSLSLSLALSGWWTSDSAISVGSRLGCQHQQHKLSAQTIHWYTHTHYKHTHTHYTYTHIHTLC